MENYTTPEQDQAERETAGFAARTTIDDTIGKLMFIRERLFMDIPLGLHGHILDAEAAVEEALALAETLPEAPQSRDTVWALGRVSASACLSEGCSCGMPSWDWSPKSGDTPA